MVDCLAAYLAVRLADWSAAYSVATLVDMSATRLAERLVESMDLMSVALKVVQ